jgi:hypothetical protein
MCPYSIDMPKPVGMFSPPGMFWNVDVVLAALLLRPSNA